MDFISRTARATVTLGQAQISGRRNHLARKPVAEPLAKRRLLALLDLAGVPRLRNPGRVTRPLDGLSEALPQKAHRVGCHRVGGIRGVVGF